MSRFDIGEQPCDNFIDGDPMYNEHECLCPFDGTHPCNSTTSFCENCHKDHHAGGYDSCAGCSSERKTSRKLAQPATKLDKEEK